VYLCLDIRLHKPCSLRFHPHTAEHATIAFPSRVLPRFALVDSKVISRCFLAGEIICWNPAACLGFLLPPIKPGLSQRCAHHKGCRNGIFTSLPFMISNNHHTHGRTHTCEHTQTHPYQNPETQACDQNPRNKNEAMSRERAIRCRKKQEFVGKAKTR
jgi:hypothetical protein